MASFLGLDLGTDFQIGGISLAVSVILFSIIAVIFLIILFYFVYQYRVYNRKIVLFENIAGRGYQPVFKDRARLVKLGDAGEELLYLLKKKAYRTAYGSKMGKNTYWFAVGQDGYWYNFVLGDLDAKMGMLDIEPIDRDMRYMHTAIRKNIQERYRKQGFMERYGAVVVSGILLILFIGGAWFMLDKIGEIAGSVASSVDASRETVEVAKQILVAADNLKSGGSGLIPAPGT